MQLKNVIFDFGQVMVHYDPHGMTACYVTDPDDAALIEEVVFDRLYWDALDDGSISDEALLAACRGRLPERLWDVAQAVYDNWFYHLPEIEGMRELVHELKGRGMRVFLLSNVSSGFAMHAHEFSIFDDFDGCVFSGPLGIVKPHAEIFSHLCKTYGILPSEALFVDDNEKNIRGGEAYGICGYLFDGDVQRLRKYLNQIIDSH